MVITFFQNIILICWLIFILYWGVSSFFVKKSVTKRYLVHSLYWRFVLILGVITLFIIKGDSFKENLSSAIASGIFQSTPALMFIGSALTVVGLVGAIWARIFLGRNWSGYVTYKKDHELVTNGPYKFIRHPIYTSMLLMTLGTFIYSGLYFVLGMFLIALIAFSWRVKKEEEIMKRLFGKKYLDYMKRTKALVPGIY